MSNPQAGVGGGGGGGFPPAKRPRFDTLPGPAGNRMMGNRPPAATNTMQPGGPKQGPGQPFGNRNVSATGRGPHNPFQAHGQNQAAVRPPIHLGNGGPPPVAFHPAPSMTPAAAAAAAAGGIAAPMRGHPARARGAPNAPRGPAHMRRNANPNGNDLSSSAASSAPSGIKGFDKAQSKKRNQGGKEKDNKDVKPTMTDFRIVGVKFGSGENVWEWGIVDGKVPDIVAVGECETKSQSQLPEAEPEPEKVTIKQEPDVEAQNVALALAVPSVTGNDTLPAETEDVVEEKDRVKDEEKDVKDEKEKKKRGEKRKAKSPDAGVFYPPFPKNALSGFLRFMF